MVQRLDPITGRVVFTVHMPDGTSQVTCCCFGDDMNILSISSAAESRDPNIEPHAGIYAVKLPFKGRYLVSDLRIRSAMLLITFYSHKHFD
jgi:sugar lactone lactonase YvrE